MGLFDLKTTGERVSKIAASVRSAVTDFRSGFASDAAAVAPPSTPTPERKAGYDATHGPITKEAFDQISNWMSGQGGFNDTAIATKYLLAATIDWQTITNVCRASWLARKIVWKKPKDMIRAGYNPVWDGSGDRKDGSNQTQGDAFRYAVTQKWNADTKMIEAVAWARQYGGSVIVIDIKGQKLEDPLPIKDGKPDYSSIGKNGLQSLMVWDRWRANHNGVMDDVVGSPNRGKPMFYVLSSDGSLVGQQVHWSRVLRFDGDTVDWWTWRANACWHDSVLQVLFDTLRQYDSTVGAISSLIPKALRDVVFAKNAAKMASTSEGEAALSRRYATTARIASMWNVTLYDLENEKQEQRTFNFAGLDKIWEKSMREAGGGAGYPISILFDEQPDGLNASGGASKQNYNDEVEAERKIVMEQQHLALLECIARNEFGELPAGFAITYNSLNRPSPTEDAAINKSNAEADHVRITDGVITPGLAAREAKDRSVYRTMRQEDVDMAELAPPPMEEPVLGVPELPAPEAEVAPVVEPEKPAVKTKAKPPAGALA